MIRLTINFYLSAPSIFGMDDVKKGALLQLFGGVNKFTGDKPGNPRIR
jgi:DNA replication licensing factor MCM4